MKKAKWLLITIALPYLNGCGDKDLFKDSSAETAKQEKQIQAQSQFDELSIDKVKYEVIASDEPNKYTVLISWPKNYGPMKILENNKVLFQTSGKINSFEDKVSGGAELNYDIQQLTTDGSTTIQVKNAVSIPLDYVFSEKTTLTEEIKFSGGRLFLLNKSLIQTRSFNMNFDVEELISEESIIETYPANTKESFEKNAPPAGNVTIKAKRGRGKLSAFIRGIHGGDGRGSWCFFAGKCNASSGGKGGDAGYFSLTLESNDNFTLTKELSLGAGGAAGIGCAYQHYSGMQIQSYMVADFNGNCEGHGRGGSNGVAGSNGSGQLCYKLRKEDPYACN